MGKDVGGAYKPKHSRPSLEGILLVDSFDIMAPHYGLKNASAFHDLTEELVFLACVYQELDDTTAELEAEDVLHSSRRIQGHRLATELRDEAASMLQSLAEIDEKLSKFNSVVRDHPPLLSAIFERDAGQVQSLWYPAQIAILQSFFVEVDWNSAAEVLGRLAALPVREKLARGPMGNVTLRQALGVCRTYWEDVEGYSWSMSSLKNKNVRDVNDPKNLKGACESFVSDILTQCGVIYGLHDLCSSWTAADQAQASSSGRA